MSNEPSINAGVTILQGDCVEVLKTLPEGSVQTCVTSPPYYGLRDYGTASWEGGDPGCDHAEKRGGNGAASTKQTTSNGTQDYQYKHTCRKCGAVRVDNQIGLEETPEQYVAKLVEVFREVRRVLKDDGTLWLNLGDSYAGSGGVGNQRDGANKGNMAKFKNPNSYKITRSKRMERGSGRWGGGNVPATGNLKPKDLIGIPWMVAFALRADGWYLRQDIIWHKPNPMPESMTDRCTKAHEYIFLLSKSARYYFDYEAIQEPASDASVARWSQDVENQEGSTRANGGAKSNGNMKAVGGPKSRDEYKNLQYNGQKPRTIHEKRLVGEEYAAAVRNKRSVWTVTTKPYKEAHFATFPPDLIEPCILAGSRPGDAVLDPFNGSGTTGAVSLHHRRKYVGIELKADYIRLTQKRLARVQPLLMTKGV